MSKLGDRLTAAVHRLLCGTGTPVPEHGCCGCGTTLADVYVTVGCEHCGAHGEDYCWSCVDATPELNAAGLTVFAGHERSETP